MLNRPGSFLHSFICIALLFAAVLSTAHAQTISDLSRSALTGKTLTCTIANGGGVFETSGTFELQLDTPVAGSWTIPVSSGNTVARTGTYSFIARSNHAYLKLENYFGTTAAEIEFYILGAFSPTKNYFEIYAGTGSKSGTYVIGAGGSTGGGGAVPAITSSTSVTGTVGVPFTYTVAASNSPSAYAASAVGLPVGTTLNPSTGVISGTPTLQGIYVTAVAASNAQGMGSKDVTFTIAPSSLSTWARSYTGTIYRSTNGAAESVFTTLNATVSTSGVLTAQGGELTGTVNAAGTVTFNANGLGLTTGSLLGWSLNAIGTNVPLGGNLRIFRLAGDVVGVPVIASQPASRAVTAGSSTTFSFVVNGTGLTYQWYLNGQAISGATAATYFINAVTALMAGDYTVMITNSYGSVTSSAAKLSVPVASDPGRLINMSVRTTAASGNQTLIVGVVLGGTGTSGSNSLLIRGVGPTLTGLGVANALTDPKLTAYAGNLVVDSNDDWAGNSSIASAALRVGAYPLANAQTKDAALFVNPTAGTYSVHVSGSTTAAGIALAEVYEAIPTFTATTPRLINLSARAQVGTGNDVVIAGFVIGGSGPCNVLIRALGPTLTGYGVTGALADPKLTLYTGSVQTAENDNWSSAPNAGAIDSAAKTAGASGVTSGTKDAAILVTLQPGVYSAKVSGVENTTGVALIEIYETP